MKTIETCNNCGIFPMGTNQNHPSQPGYCQDCLAGIARGETTCERCDNHHVLDTVSREGSVICAPCSDYLDGYADIGGEG